MIDIRLAAPSGRMAAILGFAVLLTAGMLYFAWPATGGAPDITVWNEAVVGLGAFLIAGWVWALRPRDLATSLFLASGVFTLTFCFGAAARTPAQPIELQTLFAWLNALGASAFGVAMIALMLVYPARLPFGRLLAVLQAVVFGALTLFALLPQTPQPWLSVHEITFLEMLFIAAGVAAQLVFTWRDPRARAIATWFGLSVLFGAGGFIATVAAPATFGLAPLLNPSHAFSFFLIIYIGLAAGLTRFRLFELGDWAYRILFYAAGALLLLAVDAVLITLISVDPGPAFGLSLLLVAFIYLPLRDVIGRRVLGAGGMDEDERLQAVMDVAFSADSRAQAEEWRALMQRLFRPLEITAPPAPISAPVIREEGLTLDLPAAAGLPALSLRYPQDGRGLFAPKDQDTAARLCALMEHAEASRAAYDRGVAAERGRIARDMHDNIGAQLLRALHSADTGRKDVMIRESLTDLREIINNASEPGLDLESLLADLRAETAERLDAVGISLDWTVETGQAPALAAGAAHALRSIIREAASNAIKHSGAASMAIRIEADAEALAIRIEDDGAGFDSEADVEGNGLDNMRARASGLGGRLEFGPREAGGSRLALSIPLLKEAAP